MPYISGSANPELSWDGFAQPSQQIDTWEPDPDTIPVAGGLPDRRFTRSPTSASLGSWPAPVPRARGLPSAFAPSQANDENESSLQELKISGSTPSLTSVLSTVESSKGTKGMLSANPSLRSWPTTASGIGTAERADKFITCDTNIGQGQSVPCSTKRSIPPHLRKRELAGRACAVSATPVCEPPVETGYKAYSSEDATSSSSPSFRSEVLRDGMSEEQDMEKMITKSRVEHILSDEYRRYIDTRLIQVMEDDMDKPLRMTPGELRKMSDHTFERYFEETKARHQMAWKAKHMDGTSGTDLEPSLAAFQEQERIRFGMHSGLSEARY